MTKTLEKTITRQEVFDALWFDRNKVVYIDIETSDGVDKGSLDPWQPGSCIALVQTCINKKVELHRWNDKTRDWLRMLHDEGYTFVGHNFAFDMAFFKVHRLNLTRVIDTMILSQVLNAGVTKPDEASFYAAREAASSKIEVGMFDALFEEEVIEEEDDGEEGGKKAGRFSHSLAATAYRYANVRMKKTSANSNWLQDPLTPEQIKYAEEDVLYLERILMNLCYFGVMYGLMRVYKLESEARPAFVAMRVRGLLLDRESWESAADENLQIANILKAELDDEYGILLGEEEEASDDMFSLFGAVKRSFNVGSDTKLKKFYNIEKADEATLSNIEHPLIPRTLKFKEHKKLASTYGDGFLKYLKFDGRMHSEIAQAAAATGRTTSSKPNLQNCPPEMIKSFTRVSEGYLQLTVDYSAVESVILAYAAEDPDFIDSVSSSDVHSANARKIYNIPPDMPVDKELRRKAKGVSFGVPYGISARGLMLRGFAETLEEAQALLDTFYKTFKKVAKFLKDAVQEATVRGYTQDAFGRVRWYDIPSVTSVDEDTYKSAIASAARQGQNMKIQALSASITKQALVLCHDYLERTGYGHMTLTIHDSIFFELVAEHAAEAGQELMRLMESAGPMILPGCKTPVDGDWGYYAKRKCKVANIPFKSYDYILKDGVIMDNPQSLSDDTVAALRDLKIPETTDYTGMFAAALDAIKYRDDEWKQKHGKFVKGILALAEQHAA